MTFELKNIKPWQIVLIVIGIILVVQGKGLFMGAAVLPTNEADCKAQDGLWVDVSKIQNYYIDLGIETPEECEKYGGQCFGPDEGRPFSLTQIGFCSKSFDCLYPDFQENTCLLPKAECTTTEQCLDFYKDCYWVCSNNRCSKIVTLVELTPYPDCKTSSTICCKMTPVIPDPIPTYEWRLKTECPILYDGIPPVGTSYSIVSDEFCERICPTICVPMWKLLKLDLCVGCPPTCEFTECGSGCGPDGIYTFATKEECEEKLSKECTTDTDCGPQDLCFPIGCFDGICHQVEMTPRMPCEDAVWLDYPDCKYDTSKCKGFCTPGEGMWAGCNACTCSADGGFICTKQVCPPCKGEWVEGKCVGTSNYKLIGLIILIIIILYFVFEKDYKGKKRGLF